nr:hypothetical protein [uncultured Flavobacterium sp.]
MIKKILSGSILIFTLAFGIISCSDEDGKINTNTEANANNASVLKESRSFQIDTAFVVANNREEMASFVRNVKGFYRAGMDYQDLKETLDPDSGLSNITREGDVLLHKAYDYIIRGTAERDMKGVELMYAFQAIIQHEMDRGVKYAKDVDFESGSVWLFGVNENSSTAKVATSSGCRWYQVGCLMKAYWKWSSTLASGGGSTNGENLAAIVGVAAAVIGVLLLL